MAQERDKFLLRRLKKFSSNTIRKNSGKMSLIRSSLTRQKSLKNQNLHQSIYKESTKESNSSAL